MLETKQFYDDLSSYYHLIFENWDASMARQGDALVGLIEKELGQLTPIDARVLDAACGIGTQTLPLAAQRLFVLLPEISRQKQSPACSRKPMLGDSILTPQWPICAGLRTAFLENSTWYWPLTTP